MDATPDRKTPVKLTKRTVEALAYQGKGNAACYAWDSDLKGFGVRVFPSGRKAFLVSYRAGTRKRFLTLGTFGKAAAPAHLVNISKPWNRVRTAAGVEDVRLHDLRRTVGSWLAQAGNSLHLIGRVLNHSNASTTAVYARFGEDSVRAALEQHGARIMGAAGLTPSAEVAELPKTQAKAGVGGQRAAK